MRTFLLILLTLAACAGASVAHAGDEITLIPLIGFTTVTRVTAPNLCSRVADAMLAREKVNVDQSNSAEAILIVRPIKLELFPKRIASVRELLRRLSGDTPSCGRDSLSSNTAVLVYKKESDGSVLRVLNYFIDACNAVRDGIYCGGPVLSPGRLSIVFTHGSEKFGLEHLKKDFGLTPGFVMEHASPDILRDLNVFVAGDLFDAYDFNVEVRQEEPWALILNRLPYIEYAGRVSLTTAAVDAVRIFERAEEVNRLPRSPLASATILIPDAQERSLSFLREWFGGRGGVLKVVDRDDNRLLVRVDNLKSEVIQRDQFWEYLKINLIIIRERTRSKLYLMNDGFYAPGLGSRIPPDTSFKSMENDYYSNLTEYTNVLATKIQESLRP